MKKRLFIILIVVLIAIIVAIPVANTHIKKSAITNELTSIAEQQGLSDVNIIIKGKLKEYDLYEVVVECSNLGEFSYRQMLNLSNSMEADDAYISSYRSNGNKYEIFPSSSSVYMNGQKIYDDYKNSKSYQSAQSREQNSSIGSNQTKVTDDEDLVTCWALAKDVVKANLKSPSSAKFPFSYVSDGVSITKSGNTYTVRAWVDAENSFGAKLRSNFTVIMEKSGSGKNAKFTSKSCVIE